MRVATYYPGVLDTGRKKFRATGAIKGTLIFDDPNRYVRIYPRATAFQVGVFNWTFFQESTGSIEAYSVPQVDCLTWDGTGIPPIFSGADLQAVDVASIEEWSFDAKTYGYVTTDRQYGQVTKCTTSLYDDAGEHVIKEWWLGTYPIGIAYREELIMETYVSGPVATDPNEPIPAKKIVMQTAWSGSSGLNGGLLQIGISGEKTISSTLEYTWPTGNGDWDRPLPGLMIGADSAPVRAVQSQDPLAMARLAITESSDADKSQYINI